MVTEVELQDLMTTGLKTYFHDAFLSHDHIDTALTQTGTAIQNVTQLLLSSGVQQDSVARANYDREFFNPRYSMLRFKARLNSMSDMSFFLGFKSTLAAPVWGMTETCAGLFMDNANDPGVVYFYTGNGSVAEPAYQATPIMDMDMTRWLVYELEFNKFRWYNLPYSVPYFDKNVEAGLKQGLVRKWSEPVLNGSVLPDDTQHYILFYITNSVAATKYVDIQHVTYSEVYPD